jgi:hypothetical protein
LIDDTPDRHLQIVNKGDRFAADAVSLDFWSKLITDGDAVRVSLVVNHCDGWNEEVEPSIAMENLRNAAKAHFQSEYASKLVNLGVPQDRAAEISGALQVFCTSAHAYRLFKRQLAGQQTRREANWIGVNGFAGIEETGVPRLQQRIVELIASQEGDILASVRTFLGIMQRMEAQIEGAIGHLPASDPGVQEALLAF